MSWGRDIRRKALDMDSGAPQLLPATRQAVRAGIEARIPIHTPEWTNRRPDDAGVALVRAYEALAQAADVRLNRIPRRVLHDHLAVAGVQPLRARPATAVLAIEVGPRATGPLAVPAGSAFTAPGGDQPVVIETLESCQALPGKVASVAVLSDGWLVSDRPEQLDGMQPFGRPRAGAELWLGIDSPVAPAAVLSLAIELLSPPERPAFAAVATTAPAPPPLLRWEAITQAGAAELPIERDGTGGLSHSGVLGVRADTPAPWTPTALPARPQDRPLYWLRARLVASDFPAAQRLRRVTLNGVTGRAARSIRDEVAEPLERPVSGRSRYRLSQTPVVPGTVRLEVIDALEGDGPTAWREVDDLASAGPGDRVFLLDAATGILTFGDGNAGRAVPDGYRNVVARVYVSGGGGAGLPADGDRLPSERSVPNLAGATVLAITTGAEPETADEFARRGPTEISSRRRAVAAADYATLALRAEGVDVARAHCLPARDPRSPGGSVPGLVGVIVVPEASNRDEPPMPDREALRVVADHLARSVGVVGAEVVAAAPRYREIAVQAVLVAAPAADLGAVAAAARDEIDAWLHPLEHAEGAGWPFGEPVRWDALSRLLVRRVSSLTAVSQLSFRVGPRRLAPCVDVALEPDELPWPGAHVLEIVPEERAA